MLEHENRWKKAGFLLFAGCWLAIGVQAQDSKQKQKNDKEQQLKEWVENRSFVFKARTAIPMGRSVIQLTSDYDLRVSGDTVIAYLPYFGRAYSAPIDPTEGGLHFTSNKSAYSVQKRKKGGWNVQIKPQDYRDVQQLYLSITSDGYASLQVTSLNRQPISFDGEIVEKKDRKKK